MRRVRFVSSKHPCTKAETVTDPSPDGFTPDFIITGSVSEIKQGLALVKIFEQLLQKLDLPSGSGGSRAIPNYAMNKCLVTVYFKGYIANINKEHYVDKSFRWMSKDPATLTLNDLRTLGTAILNKFDSFSFTTGVNAYTYNSIPQGFNRVWGYFASITDAQRLFEQLLDLQGMSPEWERLSHSTVPLPGRRFNEPPEKVTQAGLLIRSQRERPTCLMKFYKAGIKFPHWPKEVVLVSKYGQVITKLPFNADD